MDNKNDIMLSIYVATYNHENYIARALDSILMQKTKYKFEVLVGEDASKDNTRAILKEYEQKYPNFFTMFYREKNMHGTACNNAQDLKNRCKGKYMIALEGDDFWIDENKIEKQIDFLENHPEYIAVAHNCVVVGEDSEPIDEEYPECKEKEYSFNHFFCEIMPGQLTTVMYRNYMLDESFDTSLISQGLSPGDRLLYFTFLCQGRVYCMQEKMSAYRHITTHGSSFSANYKFNYAGQKKWQMALIEYAKKNCAKKWVRIAEYQQLNFIMRGVVFKQISLKQAFKDYSLLDYKITVFFIGLKRLINKKILHKKFFT